MIPMRLHPHSELVAHHAALLKIQKTPKMGSEPRYNVKLNLHEEISELAEAIAAEMVVASYFGLKYDPYADTMKTQADVGTNIEVKWTRYENGHLIIYPNDRQMDVAVLVVGKSPKYYLKGWLPVAMAKRDRFKHRDQNSWWIPSGHLQPMENFKRSIYGQEAI
jgi:hypothetical protein